MAENVTVMRLEVDLQCHKCYKKLKKILCKFPQIRDQLYDQNHNMVTITVLCCNPEKFRDKLCCKGCGIIKSIEILKPKPPEKPKEAEKPKVPEKPKETEKPKEAEKPKVVEKPKEKPPSPPLPKPKCPPAAVPVCLPPAAPVCPPPAAPVCPPPAAPVCPPPAAPVCPPPAAPVCPPRAPPPPMAVPIGVCCGSCYEGRAGGPCFHGYGGPPPCYEAYYGRPIYDSYGGSRPCYVSRCDEYFSEDNTSACTIM